MPSKEIGRKAPRLEEAELAGWESLADEDELAEVAIDGDFSGAEVSLLTVKRSRLDGAAFTGAHLVRASFVDCVVVDSEWSGAELEDCRFERVEFRRCRMSGVQAHGSRFTDVAFIDCFVDGGNFRMTAWERGELRDTHLVDSDFYGAKLPGSRIHGCDLTNVDFTSGELTGTRLQRSRLEGVRGGDAFRGAVIGSDQLVPTALAVFGALGIAIDDEEEDPAG